MWQKVTSVKFYHDDVGVGVDDADVDDHQHVTCSPVTIV